MPRWNRFLLYQIAMPGLCFILTGCQSLAGWWNGTPSHPAPHLAPPMFGLRARQTVADGTQLAHQRGVLGPRAEVSWVLEAPGQPAPLMTGQSVVGPDGTIVLGPYGTFPVAGMTLAQASASIEQKLRGQVNQPRLKLQTVHPPSVLAGPAGRPGEVAPSAPMPPELTQPSSPKPGETTWQSSAGSSPRQESVVTTTWTARGGDSTVVQASGTSAIPDPAEPGRIKISETGAVPPALESGAVPAANSGSPLFMQPAVMQPAGHVVHGVVSQLHKHQAPVSFDVPREGRKVSLPAYVIGPPDILRIDSLRGLVDRPIRGPYLVGPDGTVRLGAYGSAHVAGLTLEQARVEIAKVIYSKLDPKGPVKLEDVIEGLSVEMLAYNSHVYYVITDGGGLGEQVTRLPITGNETVLDAISLNPVRGGINGLPAVSSKHHIWVVRRGPDGQEQRLPVNWVAITQHGDPTTNYQLLPGDRLYVKADSLRTLNIQLDRLLSPIERILGVTLLGSQTVNSIRFGTTGGR